MYGTIYPIGMQPPWPTPLLGFVFMGELVDGLGKKLFGDEWSTADLLAQPVRVESPVPPFDAGKAQHTGGRSFGNGGYHGGPRISAEEALRLREQNHEAFRSEVATRIAKAEAHNAWAAAAMERAQRVRSDIVRAAAWEGLDCRYQDGDTGELRPIPASVWTLPHAPYFLNDGRVPPGDWKLGREPGRSSPIFVRVGLSADDGPAIHNVEQPDSTGATTPKTGRKKGSGNYASDPSIAAQVIELCDSGEYSGPTRLTRAIKSLVAIIEPEHMDDENKIKRIRRRVLKDRNDLRE